MVFRVSELLRLRIPDFDVSATKVHLAQWNGRENPLDVFHEGQFERWQENQTQRNFQRRYVLSLIQTNRPDIWLFAGLWQRIGGPERRAETWLTSLGQDAPECWVYNLAPVSGANSLSGRLHVRFEKSARANYRNMETLDDQIIVSSLVETPRGFLRFQSYKTTRLNFRKLRLMAQERPEDWQTALSAVGGVYLITHENGAQYVGSASGETGFWGRWLNYASTGHGDNQLMIETLGPDALVGANALQFSILETFDPSTPREDILLRENWWKVTLGSRAHGLNLN